MSAIIEHADKWIQTRTQAILVVPPSFGAGGSAKIGVDISLLEITLTPAKSGNVIELEYIVFGMSDQQSITAGFILRRNGVNLFNTSDSSDNYHAINGITANTGHSTKTTPQNIIIRLTDNNSLNISSTYTIAVRHTTSNYIGAANFYFNRSSDSPATAVETGVSTAIITEYDL